jgi:hypothetical protein
MDWKKLDDKITRSPRYLFFKKYQRLLIFIQGFIVIGLLFGIIMFTIQDRQIKEQIRDNCGYVTNNYECVCDFDYVQNWKKLQKGEELNFNYTQDG